MGIIHQNIDNRIKSVVESSIYDNKTKVGFFDNH